MNRNERKDIVAELLEMPREEMQECIRAGIKAATDDAKRDTLQAVRLLRTECMNYAQQCEKYAMPLEKIEKMETMLQRLENVKRQANAVCNNAVIDGFECSICGCIVKNICVNGQWTKRIRYCPNCGGENIRERGIYDERIFM